MKWLITFLSIFITTNTETATTTKSKPQNYVIVNFDKKETKIDTLYTLACIIREKESKNDYKAVGLLGEIGAYQFMRDTWNKLCIKYAGQILEHTKWNQDFIAKQQLNELLSIYNLSEIMSIWNCGQRIPNNDRTVAYVKELRQKFKEHFESSKHSDNEEKQYFASL